MSPREEWQLETSCIGRRVFVFDVLDSTNSLAAALANDRANDGIVVLADEQTAGRGQHGRSWYSPRGAGILMSLLLFPPPELRRPVILAAWAANAVSETIHESIGLEATIKWPNDVLIGGRKVCGILIEQARATVVGIGLNVNQTVDSLTKAGLTEACALAHFSSEPLDRMELARSLIKQLDSEYERLCRGDQGTLESTWTRRLGLVGEDVLIECPAALYRGRLTQLTWEGVELDTGGEDPLRFRPESVKHITAM
jgi:BirA family biotin operon repressor/biotin-[acetyl-CoA-carboxylase] ligase